jgi:hypothetical protein
MSAQATPVNRDRLVAVLNMLASESEGEMLNAARVIRKMAKERGQLIADFLVRHLGVPAQTAGAGFSRSQQQREEDVWASYRADRERAARDYAARSQARAEELRRAMREQEQRDREAREKAARDKRQAEEAARARAEQQAKKPASSPWDDDDNDADMDWPHPGLTARERRIVTRMLNPGECGLGTWAKGFLQSVLAQKYTLTPRQQNKLDELIDEYGTGGW